MSLTPMQMTSGGGAETVGTPIKIGTITVGGTTYDKYRVVVDFGSLPNATVKNVNHGLTFNRIISMYGTAKNTTLSTANHLPIPNINPSNSIYSIALEIDSTKISITTNSDRTSWYGLITIEYY